MTAAGIQHYEATTLTYGDDGRLSCLYVVVDGRTDPAVSDFLAEWGQCCESCELDWQAVRRPQSALVGIELVHTCGDPARLRLVFDIGRDADALEQLAATEALVIGTRPYGAFANVMGACGVDGQAVGRTIEEARRGRSQLVGAPS